MLLLQFYYGTLLVFVAVPIDHQSSPLSHTSRGRPFIFFVL
jgi:hypothetical protein